MLGLEARVSNEVRDLCSNLLRCRFFMKLAAQERVVHADGGGDELLKSFPVFVVVTLEIFKDNILDLQVICFVLLSAMSTKETAAGETDLETRYDLTCCDKLPEKDKLVIP